MKKFTKVLLALTLIAAMVVPMAVSSFAKELTHVQGNYTGMGTGCGFLDGNVYCEEGFAGDSVTDLTVTVNGKSAYISNGYLGVAHTGLQDEGEGKSKNKFWVGVVGAEIVEGENTMVVTDKNGDTLTYTFESSTKALGTSYAKVTANNEKKTVTAEIAFYNDPGFAIGTELKGKCHDDHDNTATFKVTKYDEATKVYTIKAEDYVPKKSVLELQVTSEGDYKDYYVSASINSVYSYVADKGIVAASTKVALSNPTVTVDATGAAFSDASRLFDSADGSGTDGKKIEGNWPGAMTITFEAAAGAKPSYIVFYTDDDGSWNNRAPKTVTISASNDNETWTVLKENVATGIDNYNEAAYALELMSDTSYKYFKVQISEKLGDQSGYFQLEELVLLEGGKVESNKKYDYKNGAVAYNGTKPATPDAPETPENPPKTGDVVVIATLLSVVSLAGTAFVSKKRR